MLTCAPAQGCPGREPGLAKQSPQAEPAGPGAWGLTARSLVGLFQRTSMK